MNPAESAACTSCSKKNLYLWWIDLGWLLDAHPATLSLPLSTGQAE